MILSSIVFCDISAGGFDEDNVEDSIEFKFELDDDEAANDEDVVDDDVVDADADAASVVAGDNKCIA